MDVFEVLSSLSLGGTVAEHEKELTSYFLQTPDFRALVGGHHDLILGAKGSGKSAMFRVLMDPTFDVPELANTTVIPAFADDDVVLLRQLFAEGTSESEFRLGWKGFFAALGANYLVDNGVAATAIEAALDELGLRFGDEMQWEFWRRFMSRVRSGLGGLAASGELEFPFAKAKVALSPKPPLEPDKRLAALEYEQRIVRLTRLVDQAFQDYEMECWVIVDRLDEVFAGSAHLEGEALRGLLRAQSDIHSMSGALRVKTFLRSDILLRITRDAGFTNLTHLRSLVLELSADDMATILDTRLKRSEQFRVAVEGADDTSARAAVGLLMPERMSINGDYRSGFVWLYRMTMDASSFVNPRNILSVVSEATLQQMRVLHSGRQNGRPASGHLLSGTVCEAAYAQVSKTRLVDTLYAEHPQLRAPIERFRFLGATPARATPTLGQIAAAQELDGTELQRVVEDLIESGFLKRLGPQRFQIGSIYQPALAIHY